MSNEPDRYDLDEMMDRLKQRSRGESPEDGELVTRADGSQAIRVRRRKRRSRQPHKERQRRIRMLQVSAVLVLVLLLILAAGFVTIYVNTAPFRKHLADKLTVSTGAEVKLQQFRMNPTGANAHGVDLQWPEGNVLDSLSLRLLRGDVSIFSVLGGNFSGHSLSAHTGKLVLKQPAESGPRRQGSGSADSKLVRFEQCNINNLQIHVQSASGPVRLSGAEATFKPASEGQRAVLRMNRGDLLSPRWPMLRLDRAHIEFEGDGAEVIGLSLMHADDDRGLLEITGLVNPYQTDGPSSLTLNADAFLLSGLLGDSLGKLIEGRVDCVADTPAGLSLSFGKEASVELSMAFQSTVDEPFVMANLPVLFALSQILGDEWFSKPDFGEDARGMLVRRGDRVELSQLRMACKNRMAIRGDLTLQGAALSGVLQIGVDPGMIQAAENKTVNRMFGEVREGYRWVEIKVSGTAEAPEDNFSLLYQQALDALKESLSGSAGG